jgi:hypothetical protein
MALAITSYSSSNLPLLVTTFLPASPGLLELAIPLSEDYFVTTGHLVGRCNVTNRAVEPYLVLMPNVAFDEANGILY